MVLILEQLTLCSCFCMDLIYTGRSTFARFVSLFNNVSTIHQEAVQASSCTESIHRCVKSRSMQMRGQLGACSARHWMPIVKTDPKCC